MTRRFNQSELSPDAKTPAGSAPDRGEKTNPLWQSLAVGSLPLQAKLKVSQPGDASEQEADLVAERVTSNSANTLQRKCDECEDEELHRKDDGGASHTSDTAPSIVQQTLSSAGHPLDPVTRSFMESRFQRPFDNVRIHTGDQAARSAEAVDALAYTVGRDIVFGDEGYAPHTSSGQRLLAHELAHVAQQESGGLEIARQTPAPAPGVFPPTPPKRPHLSHHPRPKKRKLQRSVRPWARRARSKEIRRRRSPNGITWSTRITLSLGIGKWTSQWVVQWSEAGRG